MHKHLNKNVMLHEEFKYVSSMNSFPLAAVSLGATSACSVGRK